MAPLFPIGIARHWSGAFLALLILSAFAPTRATAGCLAQHLKRQELIDRGVNHPERLGLLDIAEAAPQAPTDVPPMPTAPCRGALCSGDPATPHMPVPPPTSLGAGTWAACFDVPTPPPSCLRTVHPADAGLLPSTAIDAIFHPPRSN